MAGFHEVVISPATIDTIQRRRAQGRSLWRVSSTAFGHVASDQTLVPLGHFLTPATAQRYPAVLAGNQVQNELKAIQLDKSELLK
jgi:hypothetical protein